MAKMENAWSAGPWSYLDEEPPELPPRQFQTPDGKRWEIREPLDADWEATHRHHGAWIKDHRRGITYRVALDPQTLEIQHLEIELTGGVTKHDVAKLGSIPYDRLEQRARELVIGEGGALWAVTEGGLEDRDGTKRHPPHSEDIAELLAKNSNWGRKELAAHYSRPVRTVDGWLRKARQELGEDAIPRRR